MPLTLRDVLELYIDPHLFEQAGNYDYPRAGSSSRRSTPPTHSEQRPEVSARLAHLRALLDQDRQPERQRLAIETLDAELLHSAAEPLSARLDRRRHRLEAQLWERDTSESPQSPPTAAQPPPPRSRRRPARYSERIQERDGQASSITAGRVDLRRPIDYSNPFEPLGDRPPRIGSPDIMTQEYTGEAQVNLENRWRAKRRKLDSDDTRQTFKGFSYGHYGQVVPGQLRMELVSCDGGQYSEPNGDSSWPEHVLQDDSSVYCTKSDRCNMILRHQGETPFCLKKLVIKAPKTGFDAAIQEGMIFVSMERDDLLARTAQYQIQYSPHRRRKRSQHGQIRLQPSHEYFNSVRSPLRSMDHDIQPSFHSRRSDSTHHHRVIESHISIPTEVDVDRHPQTVPTVPRVPDFHVTTEFEDKSDSGSIGDNEETQQETREFEIDHFLSLSDHLTSRLRGLTPTASSPSSRDGNDSSDDEPYWDEDIGGPASSDLHATSTTNNPPSDHDLLMTRLRRRRSRRWTPTTSHRRLTPSRIQVTPTLESSTAPHTATITTSTQDHPANNPTPQQSSSSKDPLVPHASFFIHKDKNMVAIKFDPPVSGKFILIKLWAPCPNANIDIQSVIAHGFAGTRFFPALTVR